MVIGHYYTYYMCNVHIIYHLISYAKIKLYVRHMHVQIYEFIYVQFELDFYRN